MRVDYLLAWLLPLLVGAGICRLLQADARFAGRHAAVLGGGWVAGVYIAALVAWGLVLLRHHFIRVRPATHATDAISTVAQVAWWLLLAVIVVRLLMLGT